VTLIENLLTNRSLHLIRQLFDPSLTGVINKEIEDESLNRIGDGGRLDALEGGCGGVDVQERERACLRRLDGREGES